MTDLKELGGWGVEELIEFLKMIRPTLRKNGFEIGVTGSVLFDGESGNDGDVIIYPRDGSVFDLSKLYSTLDSFGLKLEVSHADMLKVWRKKGSNDIKHVEVWSHLDRRLDIFILR